MRITMPAKPLTPAQEADAARLRAIFERRQQENPSLTQEALAYLCDWKTQGAVSQYLLGKIPLNLRALLKFSRALNVLPRDISPSLSTQLADFVMRQQGEAPPSHEMQGIEAGPNLSPRKYPLISFVQAGEWTDLCDNFEPGDAEAWKDCHIDLGPCGYVLRVKGPSMTAPPGERFSFPDGILLYVNPYLEPMPEQFVIARRDRTKEATFKKLTTVDGELYLEALNPDWPNRYLKLEEGDRFCGVVKHAGFDMP